MQQVQFVLPHRIDFSFRKMNPIFLNMANRMLEVGTDISIKVSEDEMI